MYRLLGMIRGMLGGGESLQINSADTLCKWTRKAVFLLGGSEVSHCQRGLASLGLLICVCASVCPRCVALAV